MEQAANPPDLQAFQADLKMKLRYLGSFFSIVLIIAGLYLLLNGILALVGGQNSNSEQSDNDAAVTVTPTAASTETTPEPSITANGIKTARHTATTTADDKAAATAARIAFSGKWEATDYTSGDITTGNYTVKLGDTLWEIAEAVYGSGTEWHQILEANAAAIKYLPNGEQALIVPGQVLTLPEIK